MMENLKMRIASFLNNKIIKQTQCLLLIVVLSLIGKQAISQDEKGGISKMPIKMDLKYKKTDGIISVKVSAEAKTDGASIPAEGAITNLYLNIVQRHNHITGDGWIANTPLDEEGEGLFELTGGVKDITKGKHEFKFIARTFGDLRYEDKDEEITIKDANIRITILKDDSTTTVKARLTEWKDSVTEVPVVGVELVPFIKRTFSLMPFGEPGLTTDENGEVSAQLPRDVIGSSDGTLTVGAKIEDHESFGNIQQSKIIPWNILPRVNAENKRNLWSTGNNAPYTLVFVVSFLIILIWGTIIYLISLLFKIRKIGKQNLY